MHRSRGLNKIFPLRAQLIHPVFICIGVDDRIGVEFHVDVRVIIRAEGALRKIHEAEDCPVSERCCASFEIDIQGGFRETYYRISCIGKCLQRIALILL